MSRIIRLCVYKPQIVSYYYGGVNVMRDTDVAIHWPGGSPPQDMPPCGFMGEAPECQPKGKLRQTMKLVDIQIK